MRFVLLFLLVLIGSQALAQPTNENLGTLTTPGTSATRSYVARQVRWFQFTVGQAIQNRFLDIDTEGTVNFGSDNDTMIALYRADGTVVAFDDDDGSGYLSALSFGTQAGNRSGYGGLDYDGRDGDLPAGTYYVAVTGFSATFGNNFSATSSSSRSGNIALNIRTNIGAGTEVRPIDYTVTEGFYFNGNLQALIGSDNFTLGILNDPETLAAELVVWASSAPTIANRLQFKVEVACTRYAIVNSVSLYNYSSNRWDAWFGGFAATSDTVLQADITTNPSRYRSTNGELKCRIRWQPVNDESPAQDAWLLSVDDVQWIVDGQ